MKTMRNFLGALIFGSLLLSQGCTENGLNGLNNDKGILPERFRIDIPNSISNEQPDNLKSANGSQSDTIQGNEIYQNLNTFIAVGEGASEIVQDIIFAIALYDIDEPMSLSFNGDDDNRVKNLEVVEGAEYDGRSWEFMLTVTDAQSEDEPDGGKALQVFWNHKPVEGIAVLKPYNIDRTHNLEALDAVFRIE